MPPALLLLLDLYKPPGTECKNRVKNGLFGVAARYHRKTPMRAFICLVLTAFATLQAQGPGTIKPGNNDLIKFSFYTDNWCMVFINGKLSR